MPVPPLPSQPSDPNRSPSAMSRTAVSVGRRPGGLTAICIIAIILGVLGILVSLLGLASLAAGSKLQEVVSRQQSRHPADPAVQAQRSMQRRMNSVTDRYRWPNAVLALLNLALAGSMVTGGIMTLNRDSRGAMVLLAAFAVGIGFELLRTGVYTFMQWEMAGVMSDMMTQLGTSGNSQHNPAAEQTAAMASMFTKILAFVSMGVAIVWAVAKMVYYAVGLNYLRRPVVQAWLGEGKNRLTMDG
jgi:hypothetical protein